MTTYYAMMMGEDGFEFAVETEAGSRKEAYAKLEMLYGKVGVRDLRDQYEQAEVDNRACKFFERLYERDKLDLY